MNGAATPEAARAVAQVIRRSFAGAEQRSYPVPEGGTRLHLTVDTGSAAEPALSWLRHQQTVLSHRHPPRRGGRSAGRSSHA
ncbi:hypothetical protein [Streptomyces sp. NPDC056891]|uniref:hypothetical protein n=1 Tax=unclassified Streptomyces TaxID=2593676 RepID=UPI0036AD4C91